MEMQEHSDQAKSGMKNSFEMFPLTFMIYKNLCAQEEADASESLAELNLSYNFLQTFLGVYIDPVSIGFEEINKISQYFKLRKSHLDIQKIHHEFCEHVLNHIQVLEQKLLSSGAIKCKYPPALFQQLFSVSQRDVLFLWRTLKQFYIGYEPTISKPAEKSKASR